MSIEVDRMGISGMDKPWHKLKDESPKNYAMFQAYLKSEPRSVMSAYKTEKNRPDARTIPGSWQRACTLYRWVERAHAWDYHIQEKQTKQLLMRRQRLDTDRHDGLELMYKISNDALAAMHARMKAGEQINDKELITLTRLANDVYSKLAGETDVTIEHNVSIKDVRVIQDQLSSGAITTEDAIAEYMRRKDEASNG